MKNLLRTHIVAVSRMATLAAFIVANASLSAVPIRAATTPAAPVNVRAYTGGKDIALLWNPAAGTSPKSYTVYRNGSAVGNVAATVAGAYVNTDRYVDANVIAGTTYNYQVRMTDTSNRVSALSTAVSATQPTAANTTPVPTVTVSTSANDLKTALNNGKAAILTWYPKFADIMARPAYAPPSSMTLMTAKNTGGDIAHTLGTTITVNESWLRAHLKDPAPNLTGMFLHEMTHVMQQYPSGPSWAQEGLAVWATHTIYNDGNTPVPGPRSYYTDGYDNSSYFVEWTAATYNLPTLARDLNITAHASTYTDDFFVSRTGKNPHDLWTQMTGVNVQAMKFHGPADQCIDVPWANNADGTQMALGTCWDTSAQAFTYYPNAANNGAGQYVIMNKCLDVRGGGTTDGTAVQLYTCNNTASQQWANQADGTLVNTNSGKCVQPTAGGTTDKTPLEIDTCNGSVAQQWVKQLL